MKDWIAFVKEYGKNNCISVEQVDLFNRLVTAMRVEEAREEEE